jgi:hypothetical protein
VLAAISPLPKSHTLALDAPRSFLEVLDRAVSFDRAHRYASANEMREALLACAHELVPEAPPTRRFVTEDIHADDFVTEVTGAPEVDPHETATITRDPRSSADDTNDSFDSGERSRPLGDPLGKTRHGHG